MSILCGSRNCLYGGGWSYRGIIDCFDAPSHIPYAFVMRVENKIHIVNIAC